METISLIIQGVTALATLGALYQIKLSKDSFKTNSHRESVKYASELVVMYLREVISLIDKTDSILLNMKLKKFTKDVNLSNFTRNEILRNGGELKNHFEYSVKQLNINIRNVNIVVEIANTIESFAVPFIECVADERVGFNAVGQTFCHTIEEYYFFYAVARSGEIRSYQNTIALYNVWSQRIKESKLKSTAEEVDKELRKILENKQDLKSIGTQ